MQELIQLSFGEIKMNDKNKPVGDNPFSRKLAEIFDYNGRNYPLKQKEFIERYKELFGEDISELSIDNWIKWKKMIGKKNLERLAQILEIDDPFDLFQQEKNEIKSPGIPDEIADLIIDLCEKSFHFLSHKMAERQSIPKIKKDMIDIILNVDDQKSLRLISTTLKYIQGEKTQGEKTQGEKTKGEKTKGEKNSKINSA